jgi:GNAT superfamily N-acetyltransferase
MHIQPFDENVHLFGVLNLVNHHLSAVVPGWTMPTTYFLQHLKQNIFQDIVDPWVIERKTLCAAAGERVFAAAHLLRYGNGNEVGGEYKNTGDVAWIVVSPDETEAGFQLLEAAQQQMVDWGVRVVSAFDAALPVTLYHGVPDSWPHIRALLIQAGFERRNIRQEAIYGGWLTGIPAPGNSPVPGMTIRRRMRSSQGFAFEAETGGEVVGWCECDTDLIRGGEIPMLGGWAELTEMFIHESWRNRDIGSWLVKHAVEWLRLAGCDRIALSVDSEDEARGAGRFYERFGWKPLSRLEIGWGYTLFTPA